MKKKSILEIISAVFISFFLYNAVDAFMNVQSVKNLLRLLPLTYAFHSLAAWFIVLMQFSVAVLIFFKKTRVYGFLVSIVWSVSHLLFLSFTRQMPHEIGGVYNYLNESTQAGLSVFLLILSFVFLVLKFVSGNKLRPALS